MVRIFSYFLTLLVPTFTVWGIYNGGYASPGSIYLAFIIIPILELILPQVPRDMTPDVLKNTNYVPRLLNSLLYVYIPILYLVIFYFLFQLKNADYSFIENIALSFNLGLFMGVCGINVAHEIGHKPGKLNFIFANMLLLPSLYTHFTREHNQWHHKYVATKEDPSSAKKDETLYSFWCRSIYGVLIKSFAIQLRENRKYNKIFFSLSNTLLIQLLFQLFWILSIYYFFSFSILIWLLLSSLVSILLLESINYIEHYGLNRNIDLNGKYERVNPTHSWNSNHAIGRILLFELTLHSDHHEKASTPYYMLQSKSFAPQLLTGYPGSILLALVPPLWFRLMNPILEKAR